MRVEKIRSVDLLRTRMLTFAYGDIHGCHDKLIVLLEKCHRFAGRQSHKHIFLGDYVDRGPDSRGVIETIIKLSIGFQL